MIKYYQITQSKKVTLSLQYDKKEVRSSVHFLYADKHQSFYKLALSFFMEVARHAQNTQRKLVIFLQFIKKKVSQMQNIHIFYGDPAMFVVTCFSVLLVSQWSQHFLTWFLVFSNSKIWSLTLSLTLLCSIPSLNWTIKLSLNWVTVSFLEIVMWSTPENHLVGQLDHTVGFIDSFQFCVSLIALYSYL